MAHGACGLWHRGCQRGCPPGFAASDPASSLAFSEKVTSFTACGASSRSCYGPDRIYIYIYIYICNALAGIEERIRSLPRRPLLVIALLLITLSSTGRTLGRGVPAKSKDHKGQLMLTSVTASRHNCYS